MLSFHFLLFFLFTDLITSKAHQYKLVSVYLLTPYFYDLYYTYIYDSCCLNSINRKVHYIYQGVSQVIISKLNSEDRFVLVNIVDPDEMPY